MRKFLIRILIFLTPIILLTAAPVYILCKSGENFTDIDALISGNRPYLMGYAYNEPNISYLKWKKIMSHKRFDVISLGSSRILQLRDQMFTKSFYNAGYTVGGIGDCRTFLKSIPKEKYPDYLIISLDQWMYNELWNNGVPKAAADSWAKSFTKYPNFSIVKNTWSDLVAGKFSALFEQQDSIKRIGLNAIINGKGFRADGSINYGNQIDQLLNNDSTYTDYQYRNTYNRIKKGIIRFQYGNEVYPKAVKETEELLQFCKLNNIKVIAFLAPFADGVYHKMAVSGHHGYITKIYPALKPLFVKYGFELYDFSSVSSCNSNDNETIDGFHAGEFSYLKLMIKILESGSVLNDAANLQQLKIDAAHPVNRYSVYK